MQLNIEAEALKKETDAGSKRRLDKVQAEAAGLEVEREGLRTAGKGKSRWWRTSARPRSAWTAWGPRSNGPQREGDYNRAAELQYGTRPQLMRELEQKQTDLDGMLSRGAMFKDEVDSEDVASVVAKWTGIPVDKLLEGEREKLLNMEDRLSERLVGQEEAILAVSNAVRRARSGLQDPNRPIGSFIFLGPTGVARPSWPALWPTSCSTTSRP